MTYVSLTLLKGNSSYVMASNTFKTFKHRLDKYGFDQDVKVPLQSRDLQGIENRCVVIYDCG